MSFFTKSVQWLSSRQASLRRFSNYQIHQLGLLSCHISTTSKQLSEKQHISRSRHLNRPNGKQGFVPQPRWLQRMHQSLLSNVTLPLPAQGRAKFDSGYLKSQSLNDLLSVVWNVEEINHQSNAVLVELWRRMDLMSVEQIISVADIFFMNNVRSSWYLGAMRAHLMEKMDLVVLSPVQVTRLVFHVLDRQLSPTPGFCLFLEELIARNMDCLSLNEVAVICHSYFTSQTRMRSLDLLDSISHKLIDEFHTLNNWYLPVFMKMFRYTNFIKISFYKDLGDLLIETQYLTKFRSLAQIMHIGHVYASVRISHTPLFTYILETCCQATYNFRLKDLAKLIWSCGTLVTNTPKDIQAINRLLTYLEYNLSLDEAIEHPDNLVDLVNGLCFLNIYSDYLLNLVFHPKMVSKIVDLGKGKDKLPQLQVIDCSLHIDYPEYSGIRLDKKSKETIVARLGNFPVESEMSIKKGLQPAVQALQSLLGSDKVVCTKLLPHFQASDIYLIWDKETSQFLSHDDLSLSSNQESQHYTRLAVQILSKMQTTYDGKPLGMLYMKLRQLKSMGYHPVLIDADDSFQFVYSDVCHIQECLMNDIAKCIGTDLSHLLVK